MWIPQSETPMQFDRELVPKKQSGSTLQPSSHERPRSRLGSSSGEKKSAPSKTLLNFWLDTFLLLNFVTLLYVATVVRFVFPAGTVADDWTLWGFSFDAWSDLQFVLLGILAMGITVHVMLHWPWVCGVLASRLLPRRDGKKSAIPDGIRTIYGVGLLIVILNVVGLAIAAAALTIQSP